MTRALASSWFAALFGAFFLCAATSAHAAAIAPADWLSWPIHDWLAGALLLAAGLRKSGARVRLWRAGAWGIMTSLLFGSLFADVQDLLTHVPATAGALGVITVPQRVYVALVGVVFAVSAAALAANVVESGS